MTIMLAWMRKSVMAYLVAPRAIDEIHPPAILASHHQKDLIEI